MEIIITDGYTLNPGDLSWKPFNELGEVKYYDRSSAIETVKKCANADIIIVNKTPIGADIIASTDNLKMIAVAATGAPMIVARKLELPGLARPLAVRK